MDEIEELNAYCRNSMISFLGITFTKIHSGGIQATMPVDSKTCQPGGLLHGGASLALAESLAGAGSYLLIDRDKYNVLGLQVSGNHLATTGPGMLFGDAKLIHQGNTTHVWEVKISREDNKLISLVRVTNIITDNQKKENQ